MADYSYLPLGWTCQSLLNNATQNLGYDMHAPTLPGHPSVRPLDGEPGHMMAGAPTSSPAGPVSNAQMRHFHGGGKGEAPVKAISLHPEIPEGTSKKEAAALAGPGAVGTNVSTPLSRDSRTPDPVPLDTTASPEGEKALQTARERSAEHLEKEKAGDVKLDTEITPPTSKDSPAKPAKDQSAPQKEAK
jgi:hypothetical protein